VLIIGPPEFISGEEEQQMCYTVQEMRQITNHLVC
jgi:hypothetical protein